MDNGENFGSSIRHYWVQESSKEILKRIESNESTLSLNVTPYEALDTSIVDSLIVEMDINEIRRNARRRNAIVGAFGHTATSIASLDLPLDDEKPVLALIERTQMNTTS